MANSAGCSAYVICGPSLQTCLHRYNVGGAILWAVLFVGAGYLFGNLPFVQVQAFPNG